MFNLNENNRIVMAQHPSDKNPLKNPLDKTIFALPFTLPRVRPRGQGTDPAPGLTSYSIICICWNFLLFLQKVFISKQNYGKTD